MDVSKYFGEVIHLPRSEGLFVSIARIKIDVKRVNLEKYQDIY
jgi:hypothetical protein